MSERELKRQLDLLFEADRVMLDRVTRLATECLVLQDRIKQLEDDANDDFKYSFYEGVIEAGDNWQVYVTEPDGEREKLSPRFDLGHHSPDGFSWGYPGSGPSQLAIGLLAHHFEDANVGRDVIAARVHKLSNRFMNERICKLTQGANWACTSVDIDDWLTDIGEL